MAGDFSSNQEVTLRDIHLPAFNKNITLPLLNARIFHAPCRYDMILGRDALRDLRLVLNFDNNHIQQGHITRPMQPFPSVSNDDLGSLATELLLLHLEPDFDDSIPNDDETTPLPLSDKECESALGLENITDTYAADIKSSLYEAANISDVVHNCTHLNTEQKQKLYGILSKYTKLFSNTLDVYPHEQIHLDINPLIPPHVTRAYPVAHSQLKLFKEELDRLVSIRVLEPTGRSEWISGTFIIPKKDGRVRWITDFRALNRALKRKVYPIPRIQDILARRSGYKVLSKLDISMQYYTFELDPDSRELTTFATPFGLYRYTRLPMGVSIAPDIAQEKMEQVLRDIDNIEIYIDDIACFSDSFDHHLQVLDEVLNRLQANGFCINPLKCEWAVQETDFLGHWLTPTGVKPWLKKVQAILQMAPPKNIKQLRGFLGLVTYYRDMWPRRSHTLAPLTDMLRHPKSFTWTPACQQAFDKMKALAASDALLVYPDHNKPFHIECDASDYQLGAVIKQDGRPVAYYTRKLNDAQKNYTTIEKELLSIVETLREFRTMLLGAEIHVYSDHRNLTHKLTQFSTQRVMRWRILLEEFGPTFKYLKGPKNVIADALSRVPTTLARCLNTTPSTSTSTPTTQQELESLWAECLLAMPACDARTDGHSEDFANELFLYHPKFDQQGRLPFHFTTIRHYQQQDANLLSQVQREPFRFFLQSLGGHEIICNRTFPRDDSPWTIVIPNAMLLPLVQWYHDATVHSTGMDRLEAMIRQHFSNPNLRQAVRSVITSCQICPQVRLAAGQPHGQLTPREAPVVPWSEVHIDSIGPWTIEVNKQKMVFEALTMLEPVFNLLEIVRYPGKANGSTAKQLFENHWLSRYPRPTIIIHDHGPEFENHDFQFNLDYAGIKYKPPNSNTPTANSVIETLHRAVGQIIRTQVHLTPPTNAAEANALVDNALATAMWAHRSSPNSALSNHSPGALVFQRDMLLDIPIITDILSITQRRQAKIHQRLLRANTKRTHHDYKVGDQVFVKLHDRKNKLSLVRLGPFPIIQVHTNHNVTIQRGPIHERISIRHLIPYRPQPPPSFT